MLTECQGDPNRVELNDVLRRKFTDTFSVYYPSINTTEIYTISSRKQASLEALSKNTTDDDSYALRPYGTNTLVVKPNTRAKSKNGLEDPSIWTVYKFSSELKTTRKQTRSPRRGTKLKKSTISKSSNSSSKTKRERLLLEASEETTTDIINKYLSDDDSILDIYTQYLIFRERSRTSYLCSGDEDTAGNLIKNWYKIKTSNLNEYPYEIQLLILSALIAVSPFELFDDEKPSPRQISNLKSEIDDAITHLATINRNINRRDRVDDLWRQHNPNDTGIRSREDEDQNVIVVLPEQDSSEDMRS